MKTKLSRRPGTWNAGRSFGTAGRQGGTTQVFSQTLRAHANLN